MSLLPSSSPLSHEMLSEKSTHVSANASTILAIQNRHRMGAVLPNLPMYFGRPNSKSDIGPYWTNGAPYDVNLAGHLVQLPWCMTPNRHPHSALDVSNYTVQYTDN